MEKKNFFRHKLYVVDNKGNIILIREFNTFLELDNFTSNFVNERELFDTWGEVLNKNLDNIFIESVTSSKELKKYKTYDIMYENNIIPNVDSLVKVYGDYLLEDRKRIKKSFLYHTPLFENMGIFDISEFELRSFLDRNLDSYSKMRRIYFELLKVGLIDLGNVRDEADYLTDIINSVDTDNLTDEDIIIEKIRSGEIEPNYYDINEYLDLRSRGRHR